MEKVFELLKRMNKPDQEALDTYIKAQTRRKLLLSIWSRARKITTLGLEYRKALSRQNFWVEVFPDRPWSDKSDSELRVYFSILLEMIHQFIIDQELKSNSPLRDLALLAAFEKEPLVAHHSQVVGKLRRATSKERNWGISYFERNYTLLLSEKELSARTNRKVNEEMDEEMAISRRMAFLLRELWELSSVWSTLWMQGRQKFEIPPFLFELARMYRRHPIVTLQLQILFLHRKPTIDKVLAVFNNYLKIFPHLDCEMRCDFLVFLVNHVSHAYNSGHTALRVPLYLLYLWGFETSTLISTAESSIPIIRNFIMISLRLKQTAKANELYNLYQKYLSDQYRLYLKALILEAEEDFKQAKSILAKTVSMANPESYFEISIKTLYIKLNIRVVEDSDDEESLDSAISSIDSLIPQLKKQFPMYQKTSKMLSMLKRILLAKDIHALKKLRTVILKQDLEFDNRPWVLERLEIKIEKAEQYSASSKKFE